MRLHSSCSDDGLTYNVDGGTGGGRAGWVGRRARVLAGMLRRGTFDLQTARAADLRQRVVGRRHVYDVTVAFP